MSVADRFSTLLGWTGFTDAQSQQYEGHIRTVKRRLETVFGATNIPVIGSRSRGSAGAFGSDADLLLGLSRDSVRRGETWKHSSTVLDEVRKQLEDRYTQTDVGRDGQAIVVAFSDGKYPVDVVPAVYKGPSAQHNNYPIYWIPDGDGWWMESGPQAHNKYINDADTLSGGKLKNVAKLLKYWRVCRDPAIPLNSFHVELLLAQERVCVGPKSYAMCMYLALKLLSERQLRALQDPVGISGLVKASNTEAKRERALQAINGSLGHAARALVAEAEGPLPEAYNQWGLVFNSYFPKS